MSIFDGVLETFGVTPTVEGLSSSDIEYLSATEGLSERKWETLGPVERLNALQTLEDKLAEIQHRPPYQVVVETMAPNDYGYFDGNAIHINATHVVNPGFRLEAIDTIAHEGRHAYQEYAVTHPGFHPDAKEVEYWAANQDAYMRGDLAVKTFGFEFYANQPVELDAVKYATIVRNALAKAA